MIEILDGVITIPNWGKHQNLEQLEARKKYQREYQRDYRRKQKLLLTGEQEENTEESSCEDSRKHLHKYLHESNVNSLDKEKDKEEDKDKNKESKEKVTCEQVVDLYRSICVSYPKVISLSEARKRAIRARLKMYSMDDFRMLFEKAEASSFLKGANNRNWSANFDWMIKDANMAKVIGNYEDGPWNKHTAKHPSGNNTAKQLDDFYNMATEWAAKEDGDKDE